MSTTRPEYDRRKFFRGTAVAAASVALPATSYSKVAGANSRLGVAFLGCGARAQAHINLIQKFAREQSDISVSGVCDVWDGCDEEYDQSFAGKVTRRRYSQGLYPSAIKCGLDPHDTRRVVRDYRRLLDRKDVDILFVATPDHWHARMTLDGLAAGKDIFVETPMTRTPAEAMAVVDAAQRLNRVVTVGAQGMADPAWQIAFDQIQKGTLGHIGLIQSGVFRNDSRGQWRFYRICKNMTPNAIDWDLFLGHRFQVNGVPLGPTPEHFPFRPEHFAQWRCQAPFSSGPISDLLVHPLTKMLAATGLRFPRRVGSIGGLFYERDGRDVPDVVTVASEFTEGCLMTLTASTISSYPLEEAIRGRLGTLRFRRGAVELLTDDPNKAGSFSTRCEIPITPDQSFPFEPPRNETEVLLRQFLECVRNRDRATLCDPELGAAATTILAMGWDSLRREMQFHRDSERQQPRPGVGT